MLNLRTLACLVAAHLLCRCPAAWATPPAPPHAHATQASSAKNDHAQAHTHEKSLDGASLGLHLNQGVRWAVDAALVDGMNQMRAAIINAQTTAPLDAERARQLAAAVEHQIDVLIATCSLSPAADAVLHVLIGQLHQAAAELRRDPLAVAGLPQMLHVLEAYPRYFDHPDWQSLRDQR